MPDVLPDWIAVDWGTTHLRAHAMGAEGVLATAASPDGMGAMPSDGYEPALTALIGPWLGERPVPVVACGMVGSRQGWVEAPYRQVPCTPLEPGALVAARTADPRLSVQIVPGLSQAEPADVMRGEETQIAGALALMPDFDGVICLPGTHSKWVRVSAAEIVSFQTCMTGELFALLSQQSVLRHGMQGQGWDDDGFATALADALSRPERVASKLFGLRAEGLLSDLAPGTARSRLSGMLVGIELAATRAYWLGQDVLVIGEDSLSAVYDSALKAQGLTPRLLPGSACVLAGLASARPAATKQKKCQR